MADAVTFHNKLARTWDERYGRRSFHQREQVVTKLLQGISLESRSWLDAGCGSGRLSRLLASQGARVTAVDAATDMLKIGEQLATPCSFGGRLRFQQVEDVATLPFVDNSFDGVLCSSVLEYLHDPIGCLSEFSRVLRPGGALLVSIPNKYSPLRQTQSAIFKVSRLLGRSGFPDYLKYSRNVSGRTDFEQALCAAGLVPQVCEYFGGPWPPIAQTWPWLGSLMMFRARRDAFSRNN
jgi:2-polyprenyl-6-hydroxyphenyl methylase/3-demethylubiquinone-9 3-methyltransferase